MFSVAQLKTIVFSCTQSHFHVADWLLANSNYDVDRDNYRFMRDAIESCNVPLIEWLSKVSPGSYEKAKEYIASRK